MTGRRVDWPSAAVQTFRYKQSSLIGCADAVRRRLSQDVAVPQEHPALEHPPARHEPDRDPGVRGTETRQRFCGVSVQRLDGQDDVVRPILALAQPDE